MLILLGNISTSSGPVNIKLVSIKKFCSEERDNYNTKPDLIDDEEDDIEKLYDLDKYSDDEDVLNGMIRLILYYGVFVLLGY